MAEELRLFAGVDAGASRTALVLGDATGRILSRVRGGPGILRPGRAGAVAERIAGLLKQALGASGPVASLEALVIGAAGAGREAERGALEEELRRRVESRAVLVTTDAAVALQSAFPEGPGIVLSAGTGSIAIGRNREGTVYRVGGWGRQFGDEGSAYSLARAGLAAVAKAEDGRGPKTLLTARMLEAAGKVSVEELIAWARLARPQRVAALAPVVCRAAAEDPVASLLVQAAAAELAHHVEALRERLSDFAIPVALSGGLLVKGSAVRDALVARLKAAEPPVNLVDRGVDPASGALALALGLRP
ncbi:N-acetylmuramic acid/N-acetylglucosamine kinase [bacterium HR33]|nr:N-acetylmuramic acid/N-acetylglucosamine kinase [bacterium HR33]